jgi:hypothetical protein
MQQLFLHGGRKNLAIEIHIVPAQRNNEHRRVLLASPIEAEARISASSLAQAVGLPIRIGFFESMTGEQTEVPGDTVRMYEDVPAAHEEDFTGIVQGGQRIKEQAVFAGWSDEHVLIATRYAMKLEAERLSGKKIYDSKLVTS